VLELDEEVDIQAQRDEEQDQADDGEGADAAADGAEVFDELLLLEGVAVCGFADAFELIFDALEVGALLLNLGAELAIAGADLGEAALDRLQIDVDGLRLGWRVVGGLSSDKRADGGREVAVKEGQEPLDERNR
jgi:hypothetical protein